MFVLGYKILHNRYIIDVCKVIFLGGITISTMHDEAMTTTRCRHRQPLPRPLGLNIESTNQMFCLLC